jgi:hypothetical protein
VVDLRSCFSTAAGLQYQGNVVGLGSADSRKGLKCYRLFVVTGRSRCHLFEGV